MPIFYLQVKLHLRPRSLTSGHVSDDDIPALPWNKSAVEVLGDFLGYLYRCTRTYLQDTHSPELWMSIESDIDFVLTHPNGWEGAQQSQIRSAAILAGLILDTPDGHSRLQLLTEGEASLHFCLGNGLAPDSLTVWSSFASLPSQFSSRKILRTAKASSSLMRAGELSTSVLTI